MMASETVPRQGFYCFCIPQELKLAGVCFQAIAAIAPARLQGERRSCCAGRRGLETLW